MNPVENFPSSVDAGVASPGKNNASRGGVEKSDDHGRGKPTPRTDAEAFETDTGHEVVGADFARELERENAELLEALEELRDWYLEHTGLPAAKANAAIAKAKGGQG